MKIAAFVPLLCIGYAATLQCAIGMEAVTNCTLGSDKSHTLALLRDHPIDSTAVYYLSKDGDTPVRLYQGDDDQSRGQNIQATCVGMKERAFVISGEFSSNYLQGVAVRFNVKAGRWERVDFAERTRPSAVYFDPEGMAVLIPNTGRNESSRRYIIYRYQTNTGQAGQTYSDHLPNQRATRIPAYKGQPRN